MAEFILDGACDTCGYVTHKPGCWETPRVGTSRRDLNYWDQMWDRLERNGLQIPRELQAAYVQYGFGGSLFYRLKSMQRTIRDAQKHENVAIEFERDGRYHPEIVAYRVTVAEQVATEALMRYTEMRMFLHLCGFRLDAKVGFVPLP